MPQGFTLAHLDSIFPAAAPTATGAGAACDERTDAPIPVTILTGFLGSGKTTLLNRILSERHGEKIAVIENEFGEVGVDNDLLLAGDDSIVEMNNGCICCTVRGDLIRILGELVQKVTPARSPSTASSSRPPDWPSRGRWHRPSSWTGRSHSATCSMRW